MRNIYAVTIAGGASSRFWPHSGDEQPKYLLKPEGTSLLELAHSRLCDLTTTENIYAVTGERQSAILQTNLSTLNPDNLLVEPARRDTLAAVTLAVEAIYRRDPEGIVAVTAADSYLKPSNCFGQPFKAAVDAGAFDDERLFCFVAKPTRPETGYGYVKLAGEIASGVREAERFVEKPDAKTAQSYVDSGEYYWNLGSFAYTAKAFIKSIEKQKPDVLKAIRAFLDTPASDKAARLKAYESAEKISVDFGVMEGASKLGALVAEASFDDIGTWDALAELGELESANTISVDSNNCEAQSEGTVAFVGCEDIVVVQSGDKTLVMKKGHGHKVREIEHGK